MSFWVVLVGFVQANMTAQEIWSALTTDYEKLVSPAVFQHGYDTTHTDTVEFSAEILYIYRFNEQMNFYDASVAYTLQWKDERLDFSGVSDDEYIKLEGSQINDIWNPQLTVANKLELIQHVASHFVLYRDGTVLFTEILSLSLGCNYNFESIPFDEQLCKIDFLSYIPPGHSNVEYKLNELTLNDEIEVHQWEIGELSMNKMTKNSLGLECKGFSVCISIERRITYTIYFMFMPGLLIVLLSYSSFWIDYRASPSRTTLASVTILASINQLYSIFASYPKIGYSNWLLNFLYINVCFTIIAMIEYVLVNRLWIIEEAKLNTARYLQKLRRSEQGNENESVGFIDDEEIHSQEQEPEPVSRVTKCSNWLKTFLKSPPLFVDAVFRLGYLIVYLSITLDFLLDFI